MPSKKNKQVQELITSRDLVISERFLTRISMMNSGVPNMPRSYLIVVYDALEKHFTMKFFSNEEDAGQFLQILQSI